MEDIVAVEVELESGKKRYFLTWGRIQSSIDAAPLEALVLAHSAKFAIGGRARRARVCESLQSASAEPYFYECFFSMCQERIPFGPRYQRWAKSMADAMQQGKELYFLGAAESADTVGSGLIEYGKDNFP